MAVHGTMRLFGRLPLSFHYSLAGFLAWFLEHVIGYRKEVIYANLARSFPDARLWRLREIAHDFYVHIAEIIVEAIWFGGCDRKRLRKSHIVEMSDTGVIADAFENSGSVTLLCSHCGNWELFGGFPEYNYDESVENPCSVENLCVVYRRLSNPFWDEVFRRNRVAPVSGKGDVVESANILRHCLKNRDKKRVYCFIADQSPYMSRHYVGTFMNQQTQAMFGSVGVAHKLGHSVVYMNMARKGRGHYEMVFTKICDDASKEDPEVLLRKYFDLLEADIRKDPANWLWSHNRWK